jgi:hypothetical protein
LYFIKFLPSSQPPPNCKNFYSLVAVEYHSFFPAPHFFDIIITL